MANGTTRSFPASVHSCKSYCFTLSKVPFISGRPLHIIGLIIIILVTGVIMFLERQIILMAGDILAEEAEDGSEVAVELLDSIVLKAEAELETLRVSDRVLRRQPAPD